MDHTINAIDASREITLSGIKRRARQAKEDLAALERETQDKRRCLREQLAQAEGDMKMLAKRHATQKISANKWLLDIEGPILSMKIANLDFKRNRLSDRHASHQNNAYRCAVPNTSNTPIPALVAPDTPPKYNPSGDYTKGTGECQRSFAILDRCTASNRALHTFRCVKGMLLHNRSHSALEVEICNAALEDLGVPRGPGGRGRFKRWTHDPLLDDNVELKDCYAPQAFLAHGQAHGVMTHLLEWLREEGLGLTCFG